MNNQSPFPRYSVASTGGSAPRPIMPIADEEYDVPHTQDTGETRPTMAGHAQPERQGTAERGGAPVEQTASVGSEPNERPRPTAVVRAEVPREGTPDHDRADEFVPGEPRRAAAEYALPASENIEPELRTEHTEREGENSSSPASREAIPEHADLVTVEDAVAIFRDAGLPRHLRTIQKYCARTKGRALTCYQVPTENGIRYMIERGSISRFIADAAQQAPTGGLDHETQPDIVPVSQPTPVVREIPPTADLAIFEHPYVKRLEAGMERLEEKNDRLQQQLQTVLEQANERLIELHKANAVAQSETLGTFLLEAEKIRRGIGESADTPSPDVVHSRAGQIPAN